MKASTTKVVLSAVALASAAFAQTSYADEGVAYNIGAISEYRYRGLGQTRGKPALQGGIDYDSGKGFYLGTWASTIKWIKDYGDAVATNNDVKGPVELDIYGGYKFEAGSAAYDFGMLRYQYVGNTLEKTGTGTTWKNANTTELYGAVTVGVVTAKYSYAITDLFGQYNFTANKGTKGSGYLDLSATFDMGNGWSFVPHMGHQKVSGLEPDVLASYTDTSLTLNKDLGGGLSASVSAIRTNADRNYWTYAPANDPSKTYYQGKGQVVAGLKYTF